MQGTYALEHVRHDLQQLASRLGLEPTAKLHELLATATAAKHQGGSNRSVVAKAAARRAFAQDETARRALCHLIAPDYTCINALLPENRRYQAPAGCRGLLGE